MCAETSSIPLKYGIVIVNARGVSQFSCGLEDDELLKLFDDPERVRELCRRRMFALETQRNSYVGVAAPINDNASALLIHSGEGLDELVEFVAGIDFSFDILNQLVSSPFDGMTVVDAEGRIAFLSQVHEKFFGLSRGEAIGRHASEIIENSGLHNVVKTGTAQIAQILHTHGESRIVSRVPVYRDGSIVGAVGRVMFKGPDQMIAMSRELKQLKSEVAYYKREYESLRNGTYGFEQIIGSSSAIRKLKSDIARVAGIDVPVLVIGESGTGKELVAQAIHKLSLRRDKPMIMVNSAAMPDNLVESELFGYEGGAFTGAQRSGRQGKVEAANDSTLFLDEIGDMPLDVQVKMLRVLQDGTFERVGGGKQRHSDFRLISATNRPLNDMIERDEFRLDLYYRISGVVIQVPPLRDRLDDIPELVDHVMDSFAERHRIAARRIDPRVFEFLQHHAWPGNVRQLVHEVERALIFCDGPVLRPEDFEVLDSPIKRSEVLPNLAPQQGETLKDALERVEIVAIRDALAEYKGNKKKVAEALGISRSYLYKRLEEIGEDQDVL